MNKKGQFDYPIATLIVIVFLTLLMAPIILKIFNSFLDVIPAQLSSVDNSNVSTEAFTRVLNTGVSFFDKIIVFSFFLSIVILFISAFLIDTNPFWVILYILMSFFMIILTPTIMGALDNFYSPVGMFSTEVTQLTFTNFFRTHFIAFLIGIMITTGIIIYGKIALLGGVGTRK